MTCYLSGMNSPFAKGTPKQQLVMREFKKMVMNVCFMLKHFFPTKLARIGQGYTAIQHHYKNLKISMKDILFDLAASHKLMNPIRGVVRVSHFQRNPKIIDFEDNIDMKVAAEDTQWMKEAAAYLKVYITHDSRCN